MTFWDLLPQKVPKHKDSHVEHGAICGEWESTHLTPKRKVARSNRAGDAKEKTTREGGFVFLFSERFEAAYEKRRSDGVFSGREGQQAVLRAV